MKTKGSNSKNGVRKRSGKAAPESSKSIPRMSPLEGVHDIPERQLAEEELRESRQRLSDIISFLPDAAFVIDNEGKVIAWNRAMETLTGVKAEEMIGKGNYEYSLPFYGERMPILIDLALNQELEREKHYVNIQRIGDTILGESYAPNLPQGSRYLSGTASVLRKADGEIIAAIECIRDNTERRILQQGLSRSEKQYRNLVDNAPIGVYQVHVDGRMIFVNQEYAKIMNYESVSDIMTINVVQLYKDPDDRKKFLEAIKKDGVVRNYEIEMVGRRGRPINVLVSGVLERDVISGTLVDITDRRHAEEVLKRYELLSANSRDIILFMRRNDGRIIEANIAAEKAYGYSREELLTLTVHVLRAAHTKASTTDQMAEAYSKGILFETVHRRRDGSTFPVEVSSQGATIGGIQTLISVVRDITERKRAEEALRNSEDQYRRIFNNSHATMLLIDPETADIVDANPSACRYYGYDIEDLRTKKITDINILTPEQVFEEMARANAEQRNHFYFQHRLASGEIRPVDVYSGPLETRGRKLLFSIVHDISERRKAEEEREMLICELQESLSKIKTLSGLLPICASCKKIRNDKGYWEQIEIYIRDHTEVEFSHSLCPVCLKIMYPGIIKD